MAAPFFFYFFRLVLCVYGVSSDKELSFSLAIEMRIINYGLD
jgi:hypothetical protein